MSFADLALSLYVWLNANATVVFAVCLAVPLIGVAICALVRLAVRRRAQAQWLANLTLWSAVGLLALELVMVALARAVFDADLRHAPLLLLAGPPLGAVVAVAGIHWIYPLNQLAAWRTLTDIGWFVLASALVIWLMSQFRGWGILFGGGLLELAAIIVFLVWLLRRLYRRAFR